jgi:hypothetical protein
MLNTQGLQSLRHSDYTPFTLERNCSGICSNQTFLQIPPDTWSSYLCLIGLMNQQFLCRIPRDSNLRVHGGTNAQKDHAKCEMRNAKCEMRDARCEMRNANPIHVLPSPAALPLTPPSSVLPSPVAPPWHPIQCPPFSCGPTLDTPIHS